MRETFLGFRMNQFISLCLPHHIGRSRTTTPCPDKWDTSKVMSIFSMNSTRYGLNAGAYLFPVGGFAAWLETCAFRAKRVGGTTSCHFTRTFKFALAPSTWTV